MGDCLFGARGPIGPPGRRRFLRWAATHRDEDFMAAAAIVVAWSEESPTDEVGARNRGSPRKDWPRLSGGSKRGKLQVPTESRPACGRSSSGSWAPDYCASSIDAYLGAISPFCGRRDEWFCCRSRDALRTRLPPFSRCAFWREWWLSASSRICPGVFLDCTTASSVSGGGGLRPTLSPVSAPRSRGPSGVVTWRWPCR